MSESHRHALLKRFVKQSGGQKAAAIRLSVSPQFVGQMVHRLRPIPSPLSLAMNNLLYERKFDEERAK